MAERKLRDITEFLHPEHSYECESQEKCPKCNGMSCNACCNGSILQSDLLRYLQRKISAAGEMKTAIRHLLDSIEPHINTNYTVSVRTKYINKARKAMEDYLNCE